MLLRQRILQHDPIPPLLLLPIGIIDIVVANEAAEQRGASQAVWVRPSTYQRVPGSIEITSRRQGHGTEPFGGQLEVNQCLKLNRVTNRSVFRIEQSEPFRYLGSILSRGRGIPAVKMSTKGNERQ